MRADLSSVQGFAAHVLRTLTSTPVVTTVLVGLNVACSIVANAAFRVSARGATWGDFVTWQVLGNLAGFVTVLTLTGLLRYAPLSIAFPVTTGMSILGVQIVAARWLFNEPIGAVQWAGSLLIAVGIFLVQRW
jgi:multidrug transporter EmrE-like cation transporter